MYTPAEKKIQKQTCKAVVAQLKRLVGEGNQKEARTLFKVWGMENDYDSRAHDVRQTKLRNSGVYLAGWLTPNERVAFKG